jgi:hypothetical protein
MITLYQELRGLYTGLSKNLDVPSVPFIFDPIDLVHAQNGSNDGLHLLRVSRDDMKCPPFCPMVVDEPMNHFRGVLMRHSMQV